MLGTYVSAALIRSASMLVGRALSSFAGRDSWTWLEPVVGFGALITVAGVGARVIGHGTSATLAIGGLLVAAPVVLGREPRPTRASGAWAEGVPVAVAVALVLTVPF